ncbi:MAG: hypothetical protein KJN69_14140, partial [Gammaproteobacteria bacterium]|nr:hypothetical protein [Gammaproteobacteria bacterium]
VTAFSQRAPARAVSMERGSMDRAVGFTLSRRVMERFYCDSSKRFFYCWPHSGCGWPDLT